MNIDIYRQNCVIVTYIATFYIDRFSGTLGSKIMPLCVSTVDHSSRVSLDGE